MWWLSGTDDRLGMLPSATLPVTLASGKEPSLQGAPLPKRCGNLLSQGPRDWSTADQGYGGRRQGHAAEDRYRGHEAGWRVGEGVRDCGRVEACRIGGESVTGDEVCGWRQGVGGR